MNSINFHKSQHGNILPFQSAQFAQAAPATRARLQGFAKVLAGGRVVNLNKEKGFATRFLGLDDSCKLTQGSNPQVLLETIVSNLEAGVKVIQNQELSLAKIGGRLTDIALALNSALENSDSQKLAQQQFSEARIKLRTVAKDTFNHAALFSNGPSKPITLVVPNKNHWEGFSIDRCNLSTPGLLSIDKGKVSPEAEGLMLDRESIYRAFSEWGELCK